MKKYPKRAGPKSQAFMDRQKAKGVPSPAPDLLEDEEGDVLVVGSLTTSSPESETTKPAFEEVKIFLDDERPCPEGWTLARTPFEFFHLLEQGDDFLNRVTAMSFDWYLGPHQVTGIEVIKRFSEGFLENWWDDKPPYLPNLKRVNFHSSDREQASRMSTILHEVLADKSINRDDQIRFRRGLPL